MVLKAKTDDVSTPDPTQLTTEQLYREVGAMRDRMERDLKSFPPKPIPHYDRATRTQPTAISNVPVIRSGVTVSLSRKTPNAITTMKLTPTNG